MRKLVRDEIVKNGKREKIIGPVRWSATDVVLSTNVLTASVWQFFRKFDMKAAGQTAGECGHLRICTICLEEAKEDRTIDFVVQVDGSNTTKMTNHLQKCHKDIVAHEREKSVKEHVRQAKRWTII